MEFIKKYQLLNTKIGMFIFNNKPIPTELSLQHNKLMNEYNEHLKALSNGKQ